MQFPVTVNTKRNQVLQDIAAKVTPRAANDGPASLSKNRNFGSAIHLARAPGFGVLYIFLDRVLVEVASGVEAS